MMNHGKPHYFYKSVLFFDFLKCRPYLDDTQNLPDYYSYNSKNCLVKLWTDARILKFILKYLHPAFLFDHIFRYDIANCDLARLWLQKRIL